jgi:hypothetical protein
LSATKRRDGASPELGEHQQEKQETPITAQPSQYPVPAESITYVLLRFL